MCYHAKYYDGVGGVNGCWEKKLKKKTKMQSEKGQNCIKERIKMSYNHSPLG